MANNKLGNQENKQDKVVWKINAFKGQVSLPSHRHISQRHNCSHANFREYQLAKVKSLPWPTAVKISTPGACLKKPWWTWTGWNKFKIDIIIKKLVILNILNMFPSDKTYLLANKGRNYKAAEFFSTGPKPEWAIFMPL